MSVALSFQDDSRRKTLITHTLWERFVIWALVVHFITELWERYTILTFLIWLMFPFAFWFQIWKKCLKTFVLYELVFLISWDTVWTLLKRAMVACVFYLFYVFFSNAETVNALSIWTMITMTFFDLFLRKRLLLLRWTLLKFRGRRCVYHFNIALLWLFLNGLLLNSWGNDTWSKLSIRVSNMDHISVSLEYLQTSILLNVELCKSVSLSPNNFFSKLFIKEEL